MRHSKGILCLIASIHITAGASAFALPSFMTRFSLDPFSRPEYRAKCSTCHINPNGGGPRNPFGEAFERNDHMVTPEFRRAWPDQFQQSVTTNGVATGSGEIKATMLANGQDTLLEINGEHYRLNTQTAKLEKLDPEQTAKLLETPPPPPHIIPAGKLPLRDQPTFDHFLVNVPTALPYERRQLSMRFTHRFNQPVLPIDCQGCAGVGELFGFDSFSYSSIGASYGFTRALTGTVYRSPLNKTIELGGVLQLLRQRGWQPVSAALRVSVEGRDNFQEDFTTNIVLPLSRSITNRAEVFVVPMVSFNANPSPAPRGPGIPEGEMRKHQGTVGVGASIRFRPRTAFIAEWEPRVAGYHQQDSRNSLSFGLQRTTNGHVFELTLSNTLGTTTSRAVSTGGEQFSLGFNIYRRLRSAQ
ncbi:MAG: hypothetical protein HYX72_13305 [Acidobacteria bacterium]|nr:hypothetical protein [Acidobacteriota bacterium]